LVIAKVAQQVEGGIVQFLMPEYPAFWQNSLAQRPLVEHEADIEGRPKGGFDLLDLARAKAVADQAGVVDARGSCPRLP
jgi:hypothetical protein